tara:strand:- start:5044 stop:6351 length:1308 start_codon:yes stop_codon:yes gene_type:complete
MADTFTNDLRLRLQESGANSGQWGVLLNTTISNIASAFSLGSEAIPNASTHTITLADGTDDEARSMYLKCTGGGQACTVTLAPNTISKVWIISNETSFTLTFSQGSGANVAVAAGAVKMIVTDGAGSGAAVIDALSGLSISGALSASGNAVITGDVTSANLTTGNVTAANLNADATAAVYGSSSSPVVFTVTVASKTSAHPYNGDGSALGYFLDGIQSPALSLHGADSVTANSEYFYRFDQSDASNSGHPLLFYLDAAKTIAYTTGVTTNGTPGSSGAYTQIAVDRETPSVLYYQCSSHGYMGNYAYNAASTNFNGIKLPTADGTAGQSLTTNGSGTLGFATISGAFNDFAIKTADYTAVSKDQLIVNSSSAVTITLPASPSAGNVVFIKNAGTATVTVARNGSNINSTADDGELSANAGASLVYVDSTIGWKEL